jgi:hypothetical protein
VSQPSPAINCWELRVRSALPKNMLPTSTYFCSTGDNFKHHVFPSMRLRLRLRLRLRACVCVCDFFYLKQLEAPPPRTARRIKRHETVLAGSYWRTLSPSPVARSSLI